MTTATAERKRKSSRQNTGTLLNVAALKQVLATVSHAVPKRSPKPILQNVLLAGGTVTGFNGELRIEAALPGLDCEPMLLPFARLDAIVKTITCSEVQIASDGTWCTVSTDASSWRLPTENPAEYPTSEQRAAPSITRLPSDQFARAVGGVAYAHDDESTRYALSAVQIEVNDGIVVFVATDGRRVSAVQMEHDLAVDDSKTMVPATALSVISKIVGGSGNNAVQIDANASELIATTDAITVTASLVAGRFPGWRDSVKEYDTDPTAVLISELLAATNAAAVCTSESSRGVDFQFTADGLRLYGKSSEAGESSVFCPVVEAGTPCSVKLDPKFVKQFLEGLPSDGEPTVSIQCNKPGDPVQFRCDDFTGVIAPLSDD